MHNYFFCFFQISCKDAQWIPFPWFFLMLYLFYCLKPIFLMFIIILLLQKLQTCFLFSIQMSKVCSLFPTHEFPCVCTTQSKVTSTPLAVRKKKGTMRLCIYVNNVLRAPGPHLITTWSLQSLFNPLPLCGAWGGTLAGLPRDIRAKHTQCINQKTTMKTNICNNSIYSHVPHKEEGNNEPFYRHEAINKSKDNHHHIFVLAPFIRITI